MNIKLEKGYYGTRAILTSSWSEEITKYMRAQDVAELELNHAKGWHGNNLSFLSDLPQLKSLKILDLKINDVEPIHFLHELKELEVITYCNTEIKFYEFPKLEDCGLEWRPKAQSLFGCKTLKNLFVNRYRGNYFSPFTKLVNLESLAILDAPIKNLQGIEMLTNLRSLRLANLKKLTSLESIEKLCDLEELEVHTCPNLTSIDELYNLINLEKISLNDDGKIDSLKPLEQLTNLVSVLFYGSTNIIDGDLSPLLKNKKLSNISFQNRRHYSHKREDFKK